MKIERICYWIMIFVLGGLLIYKWNFSRQKPCPTITTRTETTTVTSKDSAEVNNPTPVAVKKKKKTDGRNIVFGGTLYIDSLTWSRPDSGVIIWNDNGGVIQLDDTVWYENNYRFKYADITVQNQVQGNQLIFEKITPSWKLVETTKYVTQTDTVYKEKKKSILYFGLGMYGNKSTLLRGGMLDLSLKTRNDMMYSVGRIQHYGINEGYWFGEIKLPIRLKRKS